jgi:hypothetical protein
MSYGGTDFKNLRRLEGKKFTRLWRRRRRPGIGGPLYIQIFDLLTFLAFTPQQALKTSIHPQTMTQLDKDCDENI